MVIYGKIKDLSFRPNNNREYLDFLEQNEGKEVEVEINVKNKKRTLKQSDSLHLWYKLVAKSLNEAGYTVQLVLKEKVDLDWTKDMVKELLWRPAQVAILNKESTTELNKIEEIDIVYEHLNRHLGEKFGVHVPFPTEEDRPLPEYPTNTNEITAF